MNIKRAKAARWIGGGERSGLAVAAVKSNGGGNVVISYAITIGQAKRLFIFDVIGDSTETATSHCAIARVD